MLNCIELWFGIIVNRPNGVSIGLTIDLTINGLSTENRLRSQRTQTQYKINVNNWKLINLVIRIE